MKHGYIAAAIIAATVGSAHAQTTKVEVRGDTMLPTYAMTAEEAGALDVYTADGTMIGEVDAVLGPSETRADAFVVNFAEEASDYGDTNRIIPFDDFEWSDNQLTLTIDAINVGTLPGWDG